MEDHTQPTNNHTKPAQKKHSKPIKYSQTKKVLYNQKLCIEAHWFWQQKQ